jgi:pimeloyl-ACP methyl ester carboxylesterase
MFAKTLLPALLAIASVASAQTQTQTATPRQPPALTERVHYGANAAAGHTFMHDGVSLYYEVYGSGQPLLLIHGNGGSIGEMSAQIAYFRRHYKVIAMDSRDQGRSGDSPGEITYEAMADDLAALLDHLKTPKVDVLGWSDGGIEALLLGIRHPEKVGKIASMAANLDPEGAHPEAIALIQSMQTSMPAAKKDTPTGKRDLKMFNLMLKQPQIKPEALEAITAPTLVLASDHDLISDEHTLLIYHHLPNSQLCIFPNATHMIPYDNPPLFDTTVDRFFRTPFVKKDRVKDAMTSYEALKSSTTR